MARPLEAEVDRRGEGRRASGAGRGALGEGEGGQAARRSASRNTKADLADTLLSLVRTRRGISEFN